MISLSDLFAVNGQSDDQEPWCAADNCETIEIRGEDLVVLCDDGVARWINTEREWCEVTPSRTLLTGSARLTLCGGCRDFLGTYRGG